MYTQHQHIYCTCICVRLYANCLASKSSRKTLQEACKGDAIMPLAVERKQGQALTYNRRGWMGLTPKPTVPSSMKYALLLYKEWSNLGLKALKDSITFMGFIVYPRA